MKLNHIDPTLFPAQIEELNQPINPSQWIVSSYPTIKKLKDVGTESASSPILGSDLGLGLALC